ncbi:MAG TPA: DUF6587 family protein [Caldimonas sp.]|jgi:hypothetical protein
MNAMNAQWAIVAVVVLASAVYAAWTLMPASLRRVLATAALKLPLPAVLATRIRSQAANASSCGCSGCDRNSLATKRAETATPAAARPITIHRRVRG